MRASLHHRLRRRGLDTLPSTTILHTERDTLKRGFVNSPMADEDMPASTEVLLAALDLPAPGRVASPVNSNDPPRAEDPLPHMYPGKSENGIQPSGSGRKMDHDRAGGVTAGGSSTQLVHRYKADGSSRAPQRSHAAGVYTSARSRLKPLADGVLVFGGRRWTQRAMSGTIQ
jgi:hypothetical protein